MTSQYRTELLIFIEQQFNEYRLIPKKNTQEKSEKKAFINGLMTAARIVGISYDELNVIVESTCIEREESDDLSIPAYIRNTMK